jgi:hypothetical protein
MPAAAEFSEAPLSGACRDSASADAGALQRRQIEKSGGYVAGGLTPRPGTIARTAAFSPDV